MNPPGELGLFHRARLRLTIYYLLVLAAILLCFDLGVVRLTDNSLSDTLREDLRDKASQASTALLNTGGLVSFERTSLTTDPSWSEVALFISTPSGSVLETSNSFASTVLPETSGLSGAMAGSGGFTTVGSLRNRFMVYSIPVTRRDLSTGRPSVVAVVQVAHSTRTVFDAMTRLTSLLLGGTALALAAGCLAGFWLAGKTLVPIRRSLERQKSFVGDASHELRTPVTVIRTAAEGILRRQGVDSRVRDLAQDIVGESVQLGRLVEDLGLLAVIDSRRGRLRKDPVDVEELSSQVMTAARLMGEAAGVVVEGAGSGSGTIMGDPVRLRQLFSIVVDNAIKFSNPGGQVEVKLQAGTGRFQAVIRDHGQGIPERDLPRIFERFYRSADARQREGTGLGLAIARELVEEHRGTISVRSVVGEGTEFIIDLPLAG